MKSLEMTSLGQVTWGKLEMADNNENTHYSQKVRDVRLSGEIYGKLQKFMLQWYYITKVGHLSRSMQR